jgi:8-oxo-dGTP pyrophosphatase MutT (NUDIX family)
MTEHAAPPHAIPLAATLLLLRDRGATLEVLMMRRQSHLRFMGGLWVFPGGRMETTDCDAAAHSRVVDAAPSATTALRDLAGETLSPALARGLKFAACRETFEEVGVLLARHADERPLAPDEARELQRGRAGRGDDAAAFAAMLAAHELVLELDRLVYWSHWITPSAERRRFDTRFFAIAMPHGQVAQADQQESTELAWLTPHGVTDAVARGDMNLAPPTLFTLEDLADSHATHGGVTAMLAAETGRETPPVMPRLRIGDENVTAVMPWDSAYASMDGEGTRSPSGYPRHLTCRRSTLTVKRNLAVR